MKQTAERGGLNGGHFPARLFSRDLTRLMKDYSSVLAGNLLSALLAMAVSVLLARTLDKEDFGAYSAFVALVLISATLMDLGTSSSFVRYGSYMLSQNRNQTFSELIRTAVRLKLLIALIIGVAGALWLAAFPIRPVTSDGGLVVLIPLGGAALSFFYLLQGLFQTRRSFKSYSVFLVLKSMLLLGSIAALILMNHLSVISIASMYVATVAVLAFYILVELRKMGYAAPLSRKRFRLGAKRLVSFGKWVSVSAISFSLFEQMPLTSAMALFGAAATADLSVAIALVGILSVLSASLLALLMSDLSRIKDVSSLRSYLGRVYRIIFPIAIALFVALVLLSEEIVGILYGEPYSSSSELFIVLLIPFTVALISQPLNASLIYCYGRPQIAATVNVVQLVSLAAALTTVLGGFDVMWLAAVYSVVRVGGTVVVTVAAVHFLESRVSIDSTGRTDEISA